MSRKGWRKLWAYTAMVAMLLSVISGVFVAVPPKSASAATTYTVTRTPTVPAGTWQQAFTRITITADPGQLVAGSQVVIQCPSDYYMAIRVSAPAYVDGNTNYPNAVSGDTGLLFASSDTTVSGEVYYEKSNGNFVVRAYESDRLAADPNPANSLFGSAKYFSQFTLTLTGTVASDKKAQIYIDVPYMWIPSGKREDIKIRFSSADERFSSAEVVIGRVAAGQVTVSIDDVANLSSSGGKIYPIYIKEDVAGSLEKDSESVKIKLPSGFKWRSTGNLTSVWEPESGYVIGTDVKITTDNDRELYVTVNKKTTTSGLYLKISDLNISVDESTAKFGDIVCSVSGKSTVSPSTLVIGRYGEFGATAKAFGEAPTVLAGRYMQEIGKIEIDELLAGSMIKDRTITLTLPGSAAWVPGEYPTVSSSDSDLQGLSIDTTWERVDDQTIKTRITNESAGNKPAKLVLEKAKIAVSAGAPEGDLELTVGGTAGASGKLVVAKVAKAAKLELDGKAPDVAVGTQSVEIPPILIKELVAEGIDGGKLTSDDITVLGWDPTKVGTAIAVGGYKVVRVEFLEGVLPSQPTKVEVVEGDLTIDEQLVGRAVTSDGRWYIFVPVKSTSTRPSTIKISGVKLNIWAGFPQGPIAGYLKGGAVVQTTKWFPGYTVVAATPVANIVAPAAREGAVAKSATFRIGSTIYNVGAEARAMDAAPYIKDDRTFVPVRYLAYALGVKESDVKWDAATQTVTLTKDKSTVKLVIGSNVLTVNDQVKYMDVAPELVDPGRTMLPARWVAEAFGAAVGWDPATQTVLIQW